jgi:predicted nucleic acid-binding protein
VAAAALDEEGRGPEAAKLLARASERLAPSHWKAEFANVVWKAVRFGGVDADRVQAVLDAVGTLSIISVDVAELWRGAVARGIAAAHPVYDTLFVELALRERIPLATYDRGLWRKFPTVARSPGALLRRVNP